MKRPVKTIITITVALILAGSLAYAAEKKKQAKAAVHTPEAMTPEEEALQAELLAGIEEHVEKVSVIDAVDSKKIDDARKEG